MKALNVDTHTLLTRNYTIRIHSNVSVTFVINSRLVHVTFFRNVKLPTPLFHNCPDLLWCKSFKIDIFYETWNVGAKCWYLSIFLGKSHFKVGRIDKNTVIKHYIQQIKVASLTNKWGLWVNTWDRFNKQDTGGNQS